MQAAALAAAESKRAAPAASECEYEVVTVTSDEKGAGTPANVFIALFGDKVRRHCDLSCAV